jgi:gliding motility-associated lipoprotein GldH
MKKSALVITLISLMVGYSCSTRGPVFEKSHKFENNTWDRFNQILFDIPMEGTEADYDIYLIMKPTNEFVYNNMPVYVILKTPSGEERMSEVKVQVRENGKFIGAEEGKPILIKAPLWKALRISEKGVCKLSIENMVPKIQTMGIREIGIVVEKAKKQK